MQGVQKLRGLGFSPKKSLVGDNLVAQQSIGGLRTPLPPECLSSWMREHQFYWNKDYTEKRVCGELGIRMKICRQFIFKHEGDALRHEREVRDYYSEPCLWTWRNS